MASKIFLYSYLSIFVFALFVRAEAMSPLGKTDACKNDLTNLANLAKRTADIAQIIEKIQPQPLSCVDDIFRLLQEIKKLGPDALNDFEVGVVFGLEMNNIYPTELRTGGRAVWGHHLILRRGTEVIDIHISGQSIDEKIYWQTTFKDSPRTDAVRNNHSNIGIKWIHANLYLEEAVKIEPTDWGISWIIDNFDKFPTRRVADIFKSLEIPQAIPLALSANRIKLENDIVRTTPWGEVNPRELSKKIIERIEVKDLPKTQDFPLLSDLSQHADPLFRLHYERNLQSKVTTPAEPTKNPEIGDIIDFHWYDSKTVARKAIYLGRHHGREVARFIDDNGQSYVLYLDEVPLCFGNSYVFRSWKTLKLRL